MERTNAAKGEYEARRLKRTVHACTVALIALAVLFALLVWAIAGLAMRAGLVPFVDVGYRWFDGNITSFFGFL